MMRNTDKQVISSEDSKGASEYLTKGCSSMACVNGANSAIKWLLLIGKAKN